MQRKPRTDPLCICLYMALFLKNNKTAYFKDHDYVILFLTFQRALRFLLPIFLLRLDLAIRFSTCDFLIFKLWTNGYYRRLEVNCKHFSTGSGYDSMQRL